MQECTQHRLEIIGVCLNATCKEHSIVCIECIQNYHNNHKEECRAMEELNGMIESKLVQLHQDVILTLEDILDNAKRAFNQLYKYFRSVNFEQYNELDNYVAAAKRMFLLQNNNQDIVVSAHKIIVDLKSIAVPQKQFQFRYLNNLVSQSTNNGWTYHLLTPQLKNVDVGRVQFEIVNCNHLIHLGIATDVELFKYYSYISSNGFIYSNINKHQHLKSSPFRFGTGDIITCHIEQMLKSIELSKQSTTGLQKYNKVQSVVFENIQQFDTLYLVVLLNNAEVRIIN